jgi:hypothetical protein
LDSVGSSALAEASIRWKGRTGLFLHVGVTGMDFDVLDAPVKKLWLPRLGESGTLRFAVVPREKTSVPGVARLRVCLYQDNFLLQSFRIAALTRSAKEPSGEARQRLAEALDVAPEMIPDGVSSLSRLEYSAVESFDVPPESPTRALTFVANDSAGQAVVTVKGDELFHAQVDDNLPDAVQRARDALWHATTRSDESYGYDAQNRGEPAQLARALQSMAEHGWGCIGRWYLRITTCAWTSSCARSGR